MSMAMLNHPLVQQYNLHVFVAISPTGNLLHANNFFRNKFCFAEKKIHSLSFHDLVIDNEEPTTKNLFKSLLTEKNKAIQIRLHHTTLTGEKILINWEFNASEADDSELTIEGIGHQVTETIQPANGSLPAEVIEGIWDGILTLDFNWNITYVNKKGCDILGKTSAELTGKNLLEIYPDGYETFQLRYGKVMQDKIPVIFEEFSLKWQCWYQNRVYPSDTGISIFFNDVTEQKKLETALKNQEADFKALIENTPDVVCSIDPEFNLITFNRSFRDFTVKLTGYRPKKGVNAFMYYPEDKKSTFLANAARALNGERFVFEEDFVIDSEKLFLEVSVNPIWTENKIQTGISIFAKNITFQKKQHIALAESEQRYKSLFDYNADAVFSLDLNGNFLTANPAVLSMLKMPMEDLLVKDFSPFIAPEDFEKTKYHFAEAAKGNPQQYICSIITAMGNTIIANVTKIPVVINNKIVGVNGIAKDITEKVKAEKALEEQDAKLKYLLNELHKVMDSSLDMICSFDEKGRFLSASKACKNTVGFEAEELIGKELINYVHPEDIKRTVIATKQIVNGAEMRNFENRIIHKNGFEIPLVWSARWDATEKKFFCIASDATEKKANEAAVKSSNEKYKLLFNNSPLPMWIYSVDTLMFLEVNEAAVNNYGYTREEFLTMSIKDLSSDEEIEPLLQLHGKNKTSTSIYDGYWLHRKKNNEKIYVEITAHLLDFLGQKAKLILANDRTRQLMAQEELIKTNERFSFVSTATFNAIWDWDLVSNKVVWNEGANKMFGYSLEEIRTNIYWWHDGIHPEDRPKVVRNIDEAVKRKDPYWQEEYRFKCKDGSYKNILDRGSIVLNEHNVAVRMIGAMQDLTERKANEIILQELNKDLKQRAEELASSNAELERFAYVASHDLQEPLRMVTSFLQLLDKRYKDQLDKKAHEYINFAVDGAERMKGLILDLLEYSRVNTSKDVTEEVNLKDVVDNVMLTFAGSLNEIGGTITATNNMPVVMGNKTQLQQLFQNLIGNAIKYKSEKPPEIEIAVVDRGKKYELSVRDNGIGIDPKFFNKIFIIFQRLHNREQYKGTGIGLAICKKIVERHKGKIWVSSEPGEGSTFYFTIPK